MKAYVLNLARSPLRREHVTKQLATAGMDYEFVDAVDGREMSDADVERVADAAAVARFPDWLTRAVIATALSHGAALSRIVTDSNEPALVLEDDVVLAPGLPALLDELAPRVQEREVVLLYYFGDPRRRTQLRDDGEPSLVGGRRLLTPVVRSDLRSGAAYVVSRAAAEALVEGLLPVRAAADAWGSFLEEGIIERVRCVYPAPVSVSTRFQTTLDHHAPTSLVGSLSARVQDHRANPLTHALRLNRVAIRLRSRRFQIVRGPQREP